MVFADVDGNTVEDAVFFSKYVNQETGLSSHFVLRLVRSGGFREIININSLMNQPDPDTRMFLIDVDLQDGTKELMYLSGSGRKLVILNIVADSSNREQVLDLAIAVPNGGNGSLGFSSRRNGSIELVEIGENIINLREGQNFTVESTSHRVNEGWTLLRQTHDVWVKMESTSHLVDGGWGDFSDPMTWNNSLNCSRACGDCYVMWSRICNNPLPRNGGSQCSATKVIARGTGIDNISFEDLGSSSNHSYAQDVEAVFVTNKYFNGGVEKNFRLRDCQADDCHTDHEIFNDETKNCDPNPENPWPNGPYDPWRIGQPYDPDSPNRPNNPNNPGNPNNPNQPGSGGCSNSSQCASGKLCNPDNRKCVTPYPFENIRLTYTEPASSPNDDPEVHTYPITLHSKFFGNNQYNENDIAKKYCQFCGFEGAISFDSDTYSGNAFAWCNGHNLGEKNMIKCPVQSTGLYKGLVTFDYNGVIHSGSFPYLKNVRCYKRPNSDPEVEPEVEESCEGYKGF